MTDNREELETKISDIQDRGKIDPIDATNLILLICDHYDIDPEAAMTDIRDMPDWSPDTLLRLAKPVQLIAMALEISQSNLNRAISDLTDIVILNAQLEALDDDA